MSNKQKIIVIATLFNILFEYSLRGFNHLTRQPFLPVILIATYASLFTMQGDLIQRFKLEDYHLIVLAFAYGIVYQCLISGAAFVEPTFLGIRWGHTLFVIIIWWGVLQSAVTFYIANRLVPRDWTAPLLSRTGWLVALVVNLSAVGVFQISGRIPAGHPIGYGMMILVCVIAVIVFRRLLPVTDGMPQVFTKRTTLDVVSIFTVVLFCFSALFLRGGSIITPGGASLVNALAAKVITGWTIVLAAVVVGHRLFAESIPV